MKKEEISRKQEAIHKWAEKLLKRFEGIKIIGAGGEWSGDARRGFMFNPVPSSVVIGTPAFCPNVATITLDFSGMTFGCGCTHYCVGCPPPACDGCFTAQWLWQDTHGSNASYALTQVDSTRWSLSNAGIIDVSSWIDENCPTPPPLVTDTVQFNIDAFCIDGVWYILMWYGDWALFFGTGTETTLNNSAPHCGFPVFNTGIVSPAGFEDYIGANLDGFVVITW